MAQTEDYEPGDKFASKWKRLSNGALITDFADCSDMVKDVLKPNKTLEFDKDGVVLARRVSEQYGDKVFKNTKAAHDAWKADQKAKHDTAKQGQQLLTGQSVTTQRMSQPPSTSTNPPTPLTSSQVNERTRQELAQRIIILVKNASDTAGWETVTRNSKAGWIEERIVELTGCYGVIMRRV